MLCVQCRRELGDEGTYCPFCGARQQSGGTRRLTRSVTERKIAGVCGGIAEYLNIDPVIVRLIWVILSIVPGALFGGLIAYLVAWLLIPEPGVTSSRPSPSRRLTRSAADYKIGGVCGGLAEYFGVDATAIRVLWAVLTIVPGAVIGGVLAYVLAWFIMPAAPASLPAPSSAHSG